MSHVTQQYKGAQVTTISRLRKREGIQEAVPVLVLSSQRWYCQQPQELHRSAGSTKWCSLFSPTHPPQIKEKTETAGDELHAVWQEGCRYGPMTALVTQISVV